MFRSVRFREGRSHPQHVAKEVESVGSKSLGEGTGLECLRRLFPLGLTKKDSIFYCTIKHALALYSNCETEI